LRVKTDFDAYEAGVDAATMNFGGGWNARFGIMAGAVTASASELLSGSGTSVRFDVPFAGIYGVLTNGPLFMDLEYRHDWVGTKVTNAAANLWNADLKGSSNAVSGSLGYRFALPSDWFVEPSAGFGFSQTSLGTLATNQGQLASGIAPGTISFDTMQSMLVHAGARAGTTVVVSDKVAVQPFAALSAWRELAGTTAANFSDGGGITDPANLSRAGAFYQAGLGVSAQVANTGLAGFVRGDLRFGDNLNGASVSGGLRYSFAP
jgi:outer membrane autotransporter protein